jgi:two-component system phosphate regulon response regulator PhoB
MVLVVEDESDVADLLRFNLEREGYACRIAARGDEALAAVAESAPDVILLDRMIPGVSGDEVVARLKHQSGTAHIPIILVTAKVEESDQLVGFALGADDYITKPFSFKLVLARVRAVMRRIEPADDEAVMVLGPIRLAPQRHEVRVAGEPAALTATEFRLLQALMQARGRVLSRSQLLDSALGAGVVVTDRTVDVHITGLRRKLGSAAGCIQTVRGVGYAARAPHGR